MKKWFAQIHKELNLYAQIVSNNKEIMLFIYKIYILIILFILRIFAYQQKDWNYV